MRNLLRAMIVLLAVGAGVSPVAAETKSTDGKRCQELMALFDRLVPEYERAAARHSRQLGEAECQKGNYAEGEKWLESALTSVGYKVPRS